jgi:hypothetical protein
MCYCTYSLSCREIDDIISNSTQNKLKIELATILSLNTANMASGYQFPVAMRTTGMYDVEKLWSLTHNNPIIYIPLIYMEQNLDDLFWADSDGREISPRMVLENPNISLDDSNRIRDANLEYPILVYQFDTRVYDVIDGLHRLAKAFQLKHLYIKASIISPIQLAESEIQR